MGSRNVALGQAASNASTPVVIASDQSAIPVSGTVTMAPNSSVNVNQVAGTATSVNNGTTDAGTQRVTLSSDSTGQVKLAAGVAAIGSVTANQSGTWTLQPGNTANTTPWLSSINDGTTTANNIAGDSGQNGIITYGSRKETSFSVASGVAASTDVSNMRFVVVQLTSNSGTVTFQTSNDNSNWVSLASMISVSSSATFGATTTTTGIFSGVSPGRYFRLSGSAAFVGVVEFYSNGVLQNSSVTAIQGGNYVLTPGSTSGNAPTNLDSTAYETSHVIKASIGTLYQLDVYNSKGSAQFIQLFDSTTVPADTAVPVLTRTVAASSNLSFDFGIWGRRFGNGIAVSNSSTGPTKTIGSADCWFSARYV